MSLEKRTKVKSNLFDSPINIGIVTAIGYSIVFGL
jgi:hypothetical protein